MLRTNSRPTSRSPRRTRLAAMPAANAPAPPIAEAQAVDRVVAEGGGAGVEADGRRRQPEAGQRRGDGAGKRRAERGDEWEVEDEEVAARRDVPLPQNVLETRTLHAGIANRDGN